MPDPASFQFVLPPPPPGFSGKLADVFSLIQNTLQGSLAVDSTLVGTGSVLPTSNIGPFIYTGVNPPQLYTWNSVTSQYVPAALPPTTTIVTAAQIFAWFGGLNSGVTPNQINVNWSQLIGVPSLLGGSASATLYGNTASRPAATINPQFYFDTDINCLLIAYGGAWHTVDGSPGDVKFVANGTLAGALVQNPGWTQNVAASSRVLIAAGTGSGLSTYANGDTGGHESVTLAQNQLPVTITFPTAITTGFTALSSATHALSPSGGSTDNYVFTNTGGGQATPTLSPFIAYWCLIKS